MSTNVDRELVRTAQKGEDRANLFTWAVEHPNAQDASPTGEITYYAHMYTCISVFADVNSYFKYADVYLNDRFTMDTYKATVKLPTSQDQTDSMLFDSVYAQCTLTEDRRNIIKIYVPLTKIMCGNLYVLFYDDEDKKDKFVYPVIVDINNAPSVYTHNTYKWKKADYDNVFDDISGAYDNTPRIPDAGRVDVLTAGSNTNYYNDLLSANRLISNGNLQTETSSYSGHPIYTVVFETFVPSAFSDMFGARNKVVGFKPLALHDDLLGTGCCAYLTNSADYSTNISDDSAFKIRLVEKENENTKTIPVFRDTHDEEPVEVSATGHYQRFEAYLGCSTDDTDGNGTLFDDRPTDEWFRSHTMFHADFELSGIADEWMLDNVPAPVPINVSYHSRSYVIFDNIYTPPVFEFSWYCSMIKNAQYFLLKKNGDRTNPDDWILVFNQRDFMRTDQADIPYTHILRIGDPVTNYETRYPEQTIRLNNAALIKANLPDLELDSNGHPIIKFVESSYIHYSDAEDANRNFKIMDDVIQDGLRTLVVRLSDGSDANFATDQADGEFAIIYPYDE